MLDVLNISKRYQGKAVLQGITLTVNENEIVGIIGPNGSGKTTLLNLISGFTLPDSGRISLKYSGRLGMSISRKGFFSDMSVEDNIFMYASLKKISASTVQTIFEDLQIDFLDKPFGKLSAGMKQRVSLAFAFITNSRLVLLDEPTTHLDIDAILNLRSVILKRKSNGTAFLITSHVLSDLEKICDRVYFLKEGKVQYAGNVSDLLSSFGTLENAYTTITAKKVA